MRKLFLLLLLVLALPGAAAAQDDDIANIAEKVVFIGIVQNGELVGNGSGTIIDPSGLIYTNRHVVEDADGLAIFLLDNIQELPVLRYYATPVFVSEEIDFAIIQIDRDADFNPVEPSTLNLPSLEIAEADVQIGDFVRVFGYPGIGDGYMVVTSGEIVTIQNGLVNGERVPVWYRTDTEFSGGNSGGLAVNEAGQVVGIPTWVVTEDRTSGKLGGILPINTVQTLATNRGSPQGERPKSDLVDLSLTIENTSSGSICYVFISPVTSDSWGEDQLGSEEILQAGTTRTFDLEPDFYDILLQDCDQNQLSDTRSIDLTAAPVTLTYTGDPQLASDVSDNQTLPEPGGGEDGPGVYITCDLDGETIEFNNGVEVIMSEVPSGREYTVTAIGLNGVDPVLAVLSTDTGSGSCADNAAGAGSYAVELPSTGGVAASDFSSQVTFTQDSGEEFASMSIVVGAQGSVPGEFVIIVEGENVENNEGVGDIFAVRLTEGLIGYAMPINIYMVAYTNDLDPLMYLGDPETLDPFVSSTSGETFLCDDAGNSDLCWGTSEDLSAYNVTVQGTQSLSGGPRDAMIQVPVEGLTVPEGDPQYFNFVMSSYEQQSTGNYAAVFHLGTD